MVSNTAAWLVAAKARPLKIRPAPLGVPEENQILIMNHAIGINPVDGKIQSMALFPLNYPTIYGTDVAGEVVAVGPGVTRFKKGDRVLGAAAGHLTKKSEEHAFQAFTVLNTNMATIIPDAIPFENAVVLPLGISTAAAALFQNSFLNLQLPTEPAQISTGKTVLIWGGASSVGSNAIQLAVAAGYEVITTASPKNFDYVKKLGASHVVDYGSSTVVSDLVNLFKDKTTGGIFDAIGGPAWAPVVEFAQRIERINFVVTVTPRFPEPPEGITMKQVQALVIMNNHVSKAIFENFLPLALETGTYIPAPEPLVAGKGLEGIQEAIDIKNNGTSAQKVVVVL